MDWLRRESIRGEFERFVSDATPTLLRTGYYLTWDFAHAEDLLQEALLRTAKRWPVVRKMGHPRAYVRRILVNPALAEAGTRVREGNELEPDEFFDQLTDQGQEEAALRVEAQSDLLAALSKLPIRQQVVVVLRYLEDLSEAAVAVELGWPLGTVKSTTARALIHLQQVSATSQEASRDEPHVEVNEQ